MARCRGCVAGIAVIGTAYFAAASTHPGPIGYTSAITWSAGVQVVLALSVALSIGLTGRTNRTVR